MHGDHENIARGDGGNIPWSIKPFFIKRQSKVILSINKLLK